MLNSAQVWRGIVVTRDATGALAAAAAGPAGALYVNGAVNGAAVAIAGANPYSWTVTLPALAAQDCVSMYITATVGGVATASVVTEDSIDTAWSSATRTLTSFGTLVADVATAVWAAGARTLTAFGTLVADMADAVWDELRAAHAIVGSYGATGEWAAAALGAGTTPLVVTVTDGVNPLDGAEVDITLTAVHTAPVASGYTDAFGKVTFHLDPGTYYIWVQHSRYNGTNPTAKVIA